MVSNKVSFDELIDWFGSKANMAKALDVTRSAVTQWGYKGGVPPVQALNIERISGGKFKAVLIEQTVESEIFK